MTSTLSIVIVSYNACDALVRCLESLHAAPPATPHDITIVDNASTERVVETVRGRWPNLHVIPQDQNRGFASATNVGIRASRSELILMLNGDTIVPAGAIDALVGRLRAQPTAAVAGPRLTDTDGRAELSFGWMISPIGELRQRIIGSLYAAGVSPMTSWVERETRREQFVDWVSGACLLVTRADAEAVGLLDERYFLYTEDVDFCAAIRARGRRVLFAPAAEVVHARGQSRATVPGRAGAHYRRSQIAFYEKHHPIWAPVLKAYLRLKRELPSPVSLFPS
jgi:N-acetylglucosaminyl-diphospho-decaprenol L-rhamnosyltransferase